MWYEIKQKQHKMPKARANINVYSSTLFSGLVFENEMNAREEKKYVGISHQTKNQKENVGIRTRYVYVPFCSSTRRGFEL